MKIFSSGAWDTIPGGSAIFALGVAAPAPQVPFIARIFNWFSELIRLVQ